MDSAKGDWKRKRTSLETRIVRIIPSRSVEPTGKNFAVSNSSAQFHAVAESNRLEKQTGKLNFSRIGRHTRAIFLALLARRSDPPVARIIQPAIY